MSGRKDRDIFRVCEGPVILCSLYAHEKCQVAERRRSPTPRPWRPLSSGDVIAGPLYGEEGIVFADCDLRRNLHAKRWFDAVGHYSREDVLARGFAGDGDGIAPASASPVSEPADGTG